ncbi:hypothetical protein VNO78_23652 [Psophocarpus tetragonolobus]|uniref:Uncharacterized protein n=1 Tax=Psophocarpus tetragonolobus TaxID=3891 RepID=A0AAN9S3L8_PSOTE
MAKTQKARNYIKTSFISIINSELKTQHRKRKRRVRPETSSFAAVLVFRATKESTQKVVKKRPDTQRRARKERYLWCQTLPDSSALPFFCGFHFRYCSNSSSAATHSPSSAPHFDSLKSLTGRSVIGGDFGA